eukprot:7248231-Prymnesium_polylepis.2
MGELVHQRSFVVWHGTCSQECAASLHLFHCRAGRCYLLIKSAVNSRHLMPIRHSFAIDGMVVTCVCASCEGHETLRCRSLWLLGGLAPSLGKYSGKRMQTLHRLISTYTCEVVT